LCSIHEGDPYWRGLLQKRGLEVLHTKQKSLGTRLRGCDGRKGIA
jgi:hypothetical protein